MTNPALEFIKFVSAVLACSQEFKVEVGLLKRNLLDFISVKEFSDEAVFRNPCNPFKFDMVMQNMDSCRNDDLLSPSDGQQDSCKAARWLCLIWGLNTTGCHRRCAAAVD